MMAGYVSIGNRYTDWESYHLNDKDFAFLEPKQLFMDLIKYEEEPEEWDMKSIVLVGAQNSGKTALIRYLVYLIENNPDYKGLTSVFRTNDLKIIGDKRYSYLFEGKKVLVIIKDDAISEGTDSRRAMSGSNVETTQQFCITRHILEDLYEPNGIIFMIFATQVFSRIDPTIRDTAQLKIFTNYYDQKWFKNLFDPDEVELLRIATYDGMFGSDFYSRRFAVAKTMTGDVVTLEIPYLTKEDVSYPHIDRTIETNKAIEILMNEILELGNLEEYSSSELKGFLSLEGKRIEEDYGVKFKNSDYTVAINRAKYLSKRRTLQPKKKKKSKKVKQLIM